MSNGYQDPSRESLIERMRRLLGSGGDAGMSSMAYLSTGGGVPIRQTQLAPDGLEFCEDVSPGRWVEESLSGFARVHSLLPGDFRHTPGCFIRPTRPMRRTSQSGGPRWRPGPGAPSIP